MRKQQWLGVALGVTVPILLVLVLWTFQYVQHQKIPPLAYDFIYVEGYHPSDRITVEQDGIYYQALNPYQDQKIQVNLFYHQSKTNTNTAITTTVVELKRGQKTRVKLSDLTVNLVSQERVSPDGYRLEVRREFFLTDMFAFDSKRGWGLIHQSKKRQSIEVTGRHIRVLGWIKP